jgi:enamine deaminase RidA (YjgF/YER057c/UK114 family)
LKKEEERMPGKIDRRLAELRIALPPAPAPAANYVPFVVVGNLVFVAGQLPFEGGKIKYAGKLGAGVAIEDGRNAARLCALNILAQVKAACGDLDRVARCVRLTGFVNSAPDFVDQPRVVNGASDLLAEVLGDAGRHARVAVGVAALPFNAAVEVDAIVEIE